MLLNLLLSQATVVCSSQLLVQSKLSQPTSSMPRPCFQPSTVLLRSAFSLSEPVRANSPRLNFSLCSIVQ